MNSTSVKDEPFSPPCKLNENDMQDVADLEKVCFTFPWTEEQLRVGVREQVVHVLGIWKNKRLIAYCSFYIAAEQADIVNIAVLPEFRRKGLGNNLLKGVLQYAARIGIERMFLEVRESNDAARTLYRSNGFTQVGLRAKYYPDNGEDALVMALDLSTH
ncbi:MAG: ribosomal protein S18-alanine N-acetyltransferase [Desulfovibrio sp.]|uniref:ribosomal protein S18-alanine N-acetyltransferase n=1 Tax=Desulfovibrio sp. 7SRBS1 TaxID=3378064 RepID=UPI003B3FCD5C